MNFAFDYVKHKSKPQNDGFYFDIETPRGHFFAVLDFAAHDYANLNPSLQGKLETIVSSFGSVSSFSADLFLGFLAKEINNFVHNLAEQSGGPELCCSAALCLVSGDRLSYFLRGDTKISILNNGRLQPPESDNVSQTENVPTQLGAENLENPLSDQVQDLTLQEDDVVLIMTQGVAEAIESQEFADFLNLHESDSQLVCDSLMKASAASRADRTLVVISGPYAPPAGAGPADLSQSIAELEARVNALTEKEHRRELDAAGAELSAGSEFEPKFDEQVAELKDSLRTKAATIDLLELDDKVKNISASLAGKADTAEVLELQRDVLKLGLTSKATAPTEAAEETEASPPVAALASGDSGGGQTAISTEARKPESAFTLNAALVVLLLSLIAGFIGGWLGSRRPGSAPEVWSVKTTENQITISRKDGSNRGIVTLTVSQPLPAAGEQVFSSFTDVQRYIGTLTRPEPLSSQTSQSSQAPPSTDGRPSVGVTETTVKPGDTLQKLAKTYNVPPERLMELNPSIARWPRVRIGQKIVVPSSTSSTSTVTVTPTPTPAPSPSGIADQAGPLPAKESAEGTSEVRVGRGDSLNQLARRFNTTAARLKQLNPRTNWPRIQSGQKILVPAPAGD